MLINFYLQLISSVSIRVLQAGELWTFIISFQQGFQEVGGGGGGGGGETPPQWEEMGIFVGNGGFFNEW